MFEQDINTLGKEVASQPFKPSHMAEFFPLLTREVDTTLERFFPPASS